MIRDRLSRVTDLMRLLRRPLGLRIAFLSVLLVSVCGVTGGNGGPLPPDGSPTTAYLPFVSGGATQAPEPTPTVPAPTPSPPPSGSWAVLSSDQGDLPAPADNNGQSAALVLDVDKDSLLDFVVASWSSPEDLAWYRQSPQGWTKHPVEDFGDRIEAGGAFHDIDDDGDLDLAFGENFGGNQIWWWENPYPNYGSNWPRHLIKNSGGNKHHDQTFGDFDGDGQTEFASWNQGDRALLVFEIPADPANTEPWPSQTIYTWGGGAQHEGLIAADVDQDGQVDLVGAGRWWKHQGGSSYQENVIDSAMATTRVAAGQFVSGGWLEVVLVPGESMGDAVWYEWNGGSWEPHTLESNVDHGHTLEVTDANQDGIDDILLGEMGAWSGGNNSNPVTWIYYGDGSGGFTETTPGSGQGIHEGRLGDLDGDGDLDILVKPFSDNIPLVEILLNPLQ